MSSWQDVIRDGALRGLLALNDPRAFDVALRYAAADDTSTTREAALALLGATVKSRQGAFDLLAATLKQPSSRAQLSAVRGFVVLADERAIPLLEEAARQPGLSPVVRMALTSAVAALKTKSEE